MSIVERYIEDLPENERDAVDICAPVDHDKALRVVGLLLKHGATTRQLNAFPFEVGLPDGSSTTRLCSIIKITFPEGSRRYDGPILASSYRFRVIFPDGFEIKGIEQWGMIGGDKTLLFLPQDAEK